ncbi:MAG: DUF6884 domain-containing protein [Candidatus Saliniplasma sp.]
MRKYDPLEVYLANCDEDKVELTFEEIESIIDTALPESAFEHGAWWANDGTRSQGKAWINAGYIVNSFDQNKGVVTFMRESKKTRTVDEEELKDMIERSESVNGGVGLVSCTKKKRRNPSKPEELYMESALFRKARKYCEKYHDDWCILSAKYHLLEPEEECIEPYDETLNDFSADQKRKWSEKVFQQLKRKGLLDKKLYIHAGKDYYQYLLPLLDKNDVEYEIPTSGMRIGETMSWYNEHI